MFDSDDNKKPSRKPTIRRTREEKEADRQLFEVIPFNRTEYQSTEIPETKNPNKSLDPLNINPRLAQWASELIENRALLSPSEQVRAIAAIARIQYTFMQLRTETQDERSAAQSGTEVKRFAKAFAANASRGRKGLTRRKPKPDVSLLSESNGEDDELEY